MKNLGDYIKAGCPFIYIRTSEFERALEWSIRSVKKLKLKDPASGEIIDFRMMVWKASTGLNVVGLPEDSPVAVDFASAVRHIANEDDDAIRDHIFYFINPFPFLRSSPALIQTVRDLAFRFKTSSGSHLVFIGPEYDIPVELSDVVSVIDFPLPTREDLMKVFSRIAKLVNKSSGIEIPEVDLKKAVEAAVGLTEFRAETAIALSLATKRRVDVDMIRDEKSEMLKQTEALELVNVDETMDDLGGFDVLKAHVRLRKKYFEDPFKAKEFGILKPPRGIMLIGLPGTGKSTAAKCIAAELGMPLYRLDVGGLFKGVVGASEAETRKVLKIVEAMAPAVLLLDEFEKAIAGLQSSGRTDSGVTSRVIGTMLTWMQESKAPIYKVAACNTLRNIDAAIMRRGRWDAVFSVDLPTHEERKQIFSIHLRKRNFNPEEFDLESLASASNEFVGAEIESVVEEAAFIAFYEGRKMTTDDIVTQCQKVIPIAKVDKEALESFRNWIKNRAMNVSSSSDISTRKVKPSSEAGAGNVSESIRSIKLDD